MEETVEQAIQRTGATVGPRVTPADIERLIVREYYFTALDGTEWSTIHGTDTRQEDMQSLKMLTMCVLVLRNGFTVVGHAGVAHPDNYKVEVGKKVAREKAIDQLWPILGYELKQLLWAAKQPDTAEEGSGAPG